MAPTTLMTPEEVKAAHDARKKDRDRLEIKVGGPLPPRGKRNSRSRGRKGNGANADLALRGGKAKTKPAWFEKVEE